MFRLDLGEIFDAVDDAVAEMSSYVHKVVEGKKARDLGLCPPEVGRREFGADDHETGHHPTAGAQPKNQLGHLVQAAHGLLCDTSEASAHFGQAGTGESLPDATLELRDRVDNPLRVQPENQVAVEVVRGAGRFHGANDPSGTRLTQRFTAKAGSCGVRRLRT